jgi:hypothetical protein
MFREFVDGDGVRGLLSRGVSESA